MAFEATIQLKNMDATHRPLCLCLSKNDNHKEYHMHWSKLVRICGGLHRSGKRYLVHYELDVDEPYAYIWAE